MVNEDVFEIHDFSTSSDWERFIADLEEIFSQWKLIKKESIDKEVGENVDADNSMHNIKSSADVSLASKFSDPRCWTQKQDSITFGKVKFTLTHWAFKNCTSKASQEIVTTSLKPKADSLNDSFTCSSWNDMNMLAHDWLYSIHPLIRYYGLMQFLVLCPQNSETISTPDRIHHLLGSAAIALNNSGCEVPFFCQISELNRRLFMGVMHIRNSFRTYFEMIQFPEVPKSFQYMSELIDLFKNKLNHSFAYSPLHQTKSQNNDRLSSIQLSIRYTYLFNKIPPQYIMFNSSAVQHSFFDQFTYFKTNFLSLPNDYIQKSYPVWFNQKSIIDPLFHFQLATIWPSVAEELVVDNAYHSDLKPFSAPRWSLRAAFNNHETHLFCNTTLILKNILKLKTQYNSHDSLFFDSDKEETEDRDARAAFERLTKTSPSIPVTQILNQIRQSLSTSTTNQELFSVIIDEYVFGSYVLEDSNKELFESLNLNTLKAAPFGSLGWRICLLIGNVLLQTNNIFSAGHIWKFFLGKIRQHWQNGILLPHLANFNENVNSIDLNNCLFYQKLEMLNCCIQQKIKREHNNETNSKEISVKNSNFDNFDEEDEEEFFDCTEEESLPEADGRTDMLRDSKGAIVYLLNKPTQPVFIPVTQDISPLTEDMLAKQMEILTNLGSTMHSDDLKTKIEHQSAGLLSDMEAFKAANPGAQFEDFIRWMSPRDWVELTYQDDDTSQSSNAKFGLSKRMKESTVWREIWNMARSCSVKRQKRLFNYTKEAEQILDHFENIKIHELVDFLMPISACDVIRKIVFYRQEILDYINKQRTESISADIFNRLIPFSVPTLLSDFNHNNFDRLYAHLTSVEFQIVKLFSLMKKFIIAFEMETKKPFEQTLFDTQKTRPTNMKNTPSKHCLDNLQQRDFVDFAVQLLLEPEVKFTPSNVLSQLVARLFADSERFQYEQTTSVGDRLQSTDEDFDSSVDDKSSFGKYKMRHQLPPPVEKEFIFRAPSMIRPAPYSRPSPQRMYCSLSPRNDFRIACAFTEDSAFC